MGEFSQNNKKLVIGIKKDEFSKIVDATKKPHHKVAFMLGFGSGLRVAEIVDVKKEDVDLKNRSIKIFGKGNKERIAPLPKGFGAKSLEYLPLLPRFKNKKSAIRSLQIAFKNACRKARIQPEKSHIHALRHGFANNCMENGMPLSYIKLLLGHESIVTTSVYLNANPKEALESYEEKF